MVGLALDLSPDFRLEATKIRRPSVGGRDMPTFGGQASRTLLKKGPRCMAPSLIYIYGVVGANVSSLAGLADFFRLARPSRIR